MKRMIKVIQRKLGKHGKTNRERERERNSEREREKKRYKIYKERVAEIENKFKREKEIEKEIKRDKER